MEALVDDAGAGIDLALGVGEDEAQLALGYLIINQFPANDNVRLYIGPWGHFKVPAHSQPLLDTLPGQDDDSHAASGSSASRGL